MTTMNLFDMSDTWNSAGTTFAAIKMNVTDTASAAGSLLLDLQVGGTSQFSVTKTGSVALAANAFMQFGSHVGINYHATGQITLHSTTGVLNWGSSGLNSPDLFLTRDAADTLALRRGTNPQSFRIYNTFTDASNYERAVCRWSGNVFGLFTDVAGTGSTRKLQIGTLGPSPLDFVTNGSARWQVSDAGHFIAVSDNTFDIGGTGANRPRNVWVAGSVHVADSPNSYVGPANRSLFSSPSNGIILLSNWAVTDFNRLQLGGTTSSFPALKRNGTALETKLADDSAFAPHAMQYLDVTDGITAPAAATGRARIYVDAADGDLKVVFADGTIKTIVTDT